MIKLVTERKRKVLGDLKIGQVFICPMGDGTTLYMKTNSCRGYVILNGRSAGTEVIDPTEGGIKVLPVTLNATIENP